MADEAHGVAVDSTGDLYVVGTTRPAPNGVDDSDVFVVKLCPVDTASFNPATRVDPFPSTADGAFCPPTGHTLVYGFRAFWEHDGGLPLFGYPLTEEFTEQERAVQYTERQRFEYHLELAGTPYAVELGRLGLTHANREGLRATAPFQPLPAGTPSNAHCRFFPETGHRLCFGFRDYWQSHGLAVGDPVVSVRESLALFGYPVSEEFRQDGMTVQYYERAVFEYHPPSPEPYRVLLRRLSAGELQSRGWTP